MHTTDSKTVYILLQDLPNIDKGAELVWNGNEYTCPDKFGGIAKLHKLLVERCYPWFKLKEAEQPKSNIDKALEIIKDESQKSDIRKYTCINDWGYSQFEMEIMTNQSTISYNGSSLIM